jgi:hypothetical protein
MELDDALELIGRFERTKKYPNTDSGLRYLAEGLMAAVKETGATGPAIVFRCAKSSEWCPTDADFMTAAREIREEMRRHEESKIDVTAEWRGKYGQPKDFDWRVLDVDRKNRIKAREREMMHAIRSRHTEPLDWVGMISAARELGYKDYADTWENGLVR